MKKMAIFVIFLLLVSIPPKAEAILDVFIVYGKRNNKIEKIITTALSTPKNKWERTRSPIQEKYESWAEFTSQNDKKINFIFTEYHYGKHPSIRTLEHVYADLQKNAESWNEQAIWHNKDGTITAERDFCMFQIQSRNEKSICYEYLRYHAKQNSKLETKRNILGESVEEVTTKEPEIIDDQPTTYSFNLLIDLGSGEYRHYNFSINKQQKLPSEAEKAYLLQLFEYMEAQIKNVDA